MLNSIKRFTPIFSLVLVAFLLSGCFGSSSNSPYTLTVTVVDADGQALEANVKVTSDGTVLDKRSVDGEAKFPGVRGTVDVEVSEPGYKTVKDTASRQNKALSFVLKQTVADLAELNTALAGDRENIVFGADITGDIVVDRVVNFDFNGHTLTGNVVFDTADAGEITLTGGGTPDIDGNLTFKVPNATVVNDATVSGTVTINAIGDPIAAANADPDPSYREEADGNDIEIELDEEGRLIGISINGKPSSLSSLASLNVVITVSDDGTVENVFVGAGNVTLSVEGNGSVGNVDTAAGTTVAVRGEGVVGGITGDGDVTSDDNVADEEDPTRVEVSTTSGLSVALLNAEITKIDLTEGLIGRLASRLATGGTGVVANLERNGVTSVVFNGGTYSIPGDSQSLRDAALAFDTATLVNGVAIQFSGGPKARTITFTQVQ